MRNIPFLLAAFAVCLACPSTRAQERGRPAPARLQLLAGEGAGERKPLVLANADIRVVLVGPLAETTATLTFRNDRPRQLEGELTFPLPDGATVTGFGLDVNGEMVDGVPVARELARITYEQETHKRVDPGLVEQTVGNNFRTRIYPIPPNGKRTVKVQYVSDLPIGVDGATYRLPINWGQGIEALNVRVEASEPGAEVSARVGDEAMKFDAQQKNQQVATQSFKATKPDADLVVTVKNPAARQVLVEKRVRPVTMDEVLNHRLGELGRGENYFLVSDTPMFRAEGAAKRNAPMHVGIAWDTSLSRAQADKTHELAVLRRLFTRLDPTAVITLVTFRNEPDAPKTFGAKDADKVLDELTKLSYDGGTNLGALAFVRDAQRLPGSPGTDKAAPPIDYWLLFSDGMADLGPARPKKAEVPVYTITDDTSANYNLLRAIASESGGAFLDLQRINSAQAVDRLEAEPLSLLGVDYKEGEVADLYPRGVQPVNGHVMVTGRLLVAEATLSLKYGANGIVQHRVEVTVKRDGATRTGLVPRFWAEQKVADLSADVTGNASAIEEVGKSFSLVTPNTSLLVLETAEQYVEHGIVPPANRKDVYEKFAQLIEQRRVREQQTREQRLNEVLALWDGRVKWWEQKFEYPAHFTYAEQQKHLAETAARGRAFDTDDVALSRGAGGAANEPAVLAQRGADRRDRDGAQFFAGTQAPAAATPALQPAKAAKPGGEAFGGPSIQVKPWDPDVPYLKAMREAGPDGAYAAYLKNRPAYAASPAFYLDCAEYLLAHDQKALGLRVLTNILELRLDNAPLLRIVAHRLEQAGERDLAIDLFERIKVMRPEEPQSWRDLALALDDRARWRIAGVSIPGSAAPAVDDAYTAARADDQRAIELLEHVVMTKWDRFPEIELPTLMEANALIERAARLMPASSLKIPLDPRLVKNLDCDVRIVLTWDADLTDVDLWVTEPSGEKCVYDHNRTTIGGSLSHDFTQGYGPEEYCLHTMMPGAYKVQAHYYGSTQTSLVGPVTIQATVITHFGRPDERRQALTVRLDKPKDVVDLGTVTLGK